MATTGERLVDLSTLTTGTALEHYLTLGASGIISSCEIEVELEAEAIIAIAQESNPVVIIEDIPIVIDPSDIQVELDPTDIEVTLD